MTHRVAVLRRVCECVCPAFDVVLASNKPRQLYLLQPKFQRGQTLSTHVLY